MALYLYAVIGRRPRRALGRGLAGERLRLVPLRGRRWVVVGALPAAPAPSARALRRHAATVRRLASAVDALLPVRFGTAVADEAELAHRLAPQAAALGEALRLVAGREQMTLRVYGTAARPERRGTAGGPGQRYLAARARARAVPELAPARPALTPLVRAERAERHDTPPLLATVYHLVDRGAGAAYRAALRRGRRRLDGVVLRATGPWPPYAFVPEPGG